VSAKLVRVSELRFTTLVEAPLTVAFDVARSLGGPWPRPLHPVGSERPWRDVWSTGPAWGWRTLTHTRHLTATGAGTRVEERVEWEPRLPGALGVLVDRVLLRRRVTRAVQAHLDAFAAAAARRALDVTQVVGAALVDDRRRVLVAQRGSGPLAGLWEFPGGKVEPDEAPEAALVREVREELAVTIRIGEELAGPPGGWPISPALVLRLFFAEVSEGDVAPGSDHDQVRWLPPDDLDTVAWLPSDREAVAVLRRHLHAG
jgi:8-oxo-dGTP diphosphatase